MLEEELKIVFNKLESKILTQEGVKINIPFHSSNP